MSEPTDTPDAVQPSPDDVLAAAALSARTNGLDSIAAAFELLRTDRPTTSAAPTGSEPQHAEQP